MNPTLLEIGLVFLLSFLLGFEREEGRGDAADFFGGVRAFPLLGLTGYALAKAGDTAFAAGLLGVAALLAVSYASRLRGGGERGLTAEVTAFLAYALGPLVAHGDYWAPTALVVLGVFLLELRRGLEELPRRVPRGELLTFTKFLLLSAVILPVVPNESYTEFALNPFKIALVVVVISGISYSAYVLGRLVGERGGTLLSAFLGGAYSSTVTTLVLARRSRAEEAPRLLAGSILIASGMMYWRLLALLALLSPEVAERLLAPFFALGLLAIAGGFLWARLERNSPAGGEAAGNPLQVRAALLFAFLFALTAVLTKLAAQYFGNAGIYGLSVLSGLSDVDPYIMSIAQNGLASAGVEVVRSAILVATLSNNVLKGCYVLGTARGGARKQGAAFLFGLALLGLGAFFLS